MYCTTKGWSSMNHLSIRDLPETERPYERFIKMGVESLTDSEILAILIQNGTKENSSIELARMILNNNGNMSLLSLYDKSFDELLDIPGIGKVKAIQLKCIAELSKRIHKAKRPVNSAFSSPREIAEYYMESMRHLSTERLLAVFFDGGGRFICECIISEGIVNRTLISTREIFIKAIECKAVYFMLIHNHPSGNASPSSDDVIITGEIEAAGRLMNIPLLDHLIIGDREYVSFLEAGKISKIM